MNLQSGSPPSGSPPSGSPPSIGPIEFVEIDWAGRRVRIEHQWIARERAARPVIVFLHEGLGSVAMWRDFPQALCAAAQCRGLVYSRPGYGRSTARASDEKWGIDFMHRQAHEVLPAFLRAAGVDPTRDQLVLLGHSDGGSIALLYAARFSAQLAGTIVLAPHTFVEAISLDAIAEATTAYRSGGLREGLARYHDDPDSAFWGWNDAWLSPAFKGWNIEGELATMTCRLLAVQGLDDVYGTLAHVRGVARHAPQTQILELADCGHSPHRDQTQKVIGAIQDFVGAARELN